MDPEPVILLELAISAIVPTLPAVMEIAPVAELEPERERIALLLRTNNPVVELMPEIDIVPPVRV